MPNKIIEIKAPLTMEFTTKLSLSFLVGPDRFSYLISSITDRKILQLEVHKLERRTDLVQQCHQIIESINLNSKNYESISLNLFNTIINSIKIPTKKHTLNEIDSLRISEYFNRIFPDLESKDVFDNMQNSVLRNYAKQTGIFSYWKADSVFLWKLDQGIFNFILAKEFVTTEDAMYYILYAFKSSGFNNERHKLLVSGELTEDSAILKIINSYFADIEFLKNPSNLVFPEQSEMFPEHLFFDLLSAEI